MKDCDCPYFSEEAFNSLTGPITPAIGTALVSPNVLGPVVLVD